MQFKSDDELMKDHIAKAMNWLRPGGHIHIEVPSSLWLTNRIFNWIYRLQGLDFVANISPMHAPFHLYEFTYDSFKALGDHLGYKIAQHNYIVCDTFLPRVVSPLVVPLMKVTNTGMQLEIWLRRES